MPVSAAHALAALPPLLPYPRMTIRQLSGEYSTLRHPFPYKKKDNNFAIYLSVILADFKEYLTLACQF